MLNKAEGIVLRQIKYSDSSRIVTIFTREKGKRSYFLNGIGKKKNGRLLAATQPLSLVELLVYEGKGEKGMGNIREIKLSFPAIHTRNSIIKTSIVLFLNEVINRCIREEEKDEQLFEFLHAAMISFESLHQNEQNFHLHFLVRFTGFLGIHLRRHALPAGNYFDLGEGCFTATCPFHGHYLEGETAVVFRKLLGTDFHEECAMSKHHRQAILEGLLNYYRLHLPEFGEVNSHHVLAQVLS